MEQWKRLWKNRKNNYGYLKWLMKYSKPYVGKITFMMIVNLSATVLSIVMVQITKNIIDSAIGGNMLLHMIVCYLALTLGLQILNVWATMLSTVLNERFSFGIRKQIYEKIINSHWMNIKKYHTGDLMTRLTSDATNIAEGIIGTIPNVIQLVLELLIVFFYLYYYSPLLAVLALVVAPVAAVSSWWLGRKMKKLQVKVQESEAAYRSFLQESLANLLVVKSFANEEYSVKRLVELREERFSWVYQKTKLGVVTSTVMAIAFQTGYITAFAYGAFQVSKGIITYGTMSVFLSLVNRVQSPILALGKQIPKIVSILASAGRVIELQNIPLEEKDESVKIPKQVGIQVEKVSFGYEDELILENVDLNVKAGEFVAIIGESGIGKTTLIRIIMSFMSNITGMVQFVDEEGEPCKANASTRRFVSYVPQGNTLFSGTIRENIRMGKLDATDEEIMDALKLAAGYDFIQALPKGIDTVIGERGHGLSEGQAQRIAIARAFVRKAPLLILDEATSALDEVTELQVLKGLSELEPRPTCLIITHRKSILEYCNREIVIENRQIK